MEEEGKEVDEASPGKPSNFDCLGEQKTGQQLKEEFCKVKKTQI